MEITVHIIYASTSGNTELVMENIAEYLKKRKVNTILHRAELTDIAKIKDNSHFIFGTSTWNHGIINPYFDDLLAKMETINLKGKYAGFVGLGDYRYEEVLFNHGIEILEKTFLNGGGKRIGEVLKIDGDPCNALDTAVKNWKEDFFIKLKQTYV